MDKQTYDIVDGTNYYNARQSRGIEESMEEKENCGYETPENGQPWAWKNSSMLLKRNTQYSPTFVNGDGTRRKRQKA